MHHEFLDRFSRLESPIHRLAAGIKLTGALLVSLGVVLVPRGEVWFFGAVAVFLLWVAVASRVPAAFLARRLLLLEPLALGVAVLQLFSPAGWIGFGAIVMKSTLCLLTMVLLSNTTPFSEILQVLRRIRTPAILVTVLALMYRYLFVLIDEAERMERARRSRTFTDGRRRAWGRRAGVVGQLFVRSSERAERIYAAMCARGWE